MGKKHKKHHRSEKHERRPKESDTDYEAAEKEKIEKPLKLVLKVGGQTTTETIDSHYSSDYDHYEKKHKHKKKKKKKSSEKEKHRHHHEKREKRKYEEVTPDDTSNQVPSKKVMYDEDSMDKNLRESRVSTREKISTPLESDEDTLLACLNYLQKTLQRKDQNGFFQFPVNDLIAPGYSSIIAVPMDFSTMQEKVDDGEYRNVMEYKRDFITMCENCMTYNRPETIYYKSAKKLLHSGIKMMNKDRLLNMKDSVPFMAHITNEEIGLDDADPQPHDVEAMVAAQIERAAKAIKKKAKSNSKFEAIPDNLTPEEVLAQAQAAAKNAATKLTLRKPGGRMGFLRRGKDGITTLEILNHENDGIVGEKERVVNLGTLSGKLTNGTGQLSGFKEDKRNQVKPVTYLNYGPFGTYAPLFDSSFATLPKDESDLLISCYGNETCAQYASSLHDYVEDCGDYTVKMVDRMLDILTGGEHSKTMKQIDTIHKEVEEKKKQEAKQAAKVENMGEGDKKPEVDINSLRSLSDVGIDTSFLDEYEKMEMSQDDIDKEGVKQIQQKLDANSELIKDLHRVQTERLSKPVSHLAFIPGPSEEESQLAEKVTKGLTELAKKVTPSHVISTQGVHKALGIKMEPADTDSDDKNMDTQSLANLSADDNPTDELDKDLTSFLEQGPSLRVCDSPSLK